MVQDKVFLDANIILEILLDRKNNLKARKLIAAHAGKLYISSLTVHIAVYFGQQEQELPVIKTLLSDYHIESLTSQDTAWAFNNVRNDDFEDALQLAIAIRANCQEFVTFDKTLFDTYKDLATIKVVLLNK